MFIEESEIIEVEGTREELEAEVRRVGLVGEGDNQYGSLREFLDCNDIRMYDTFVVPEKMTIEEIVSNWS